MGNSLSQNKHHTHILKKILWKETCQWLATGWWFSPGTPVSSTNKTERHYITEILLIVVLNTITITSNYHMTKIIRTVVINYVKNNTINYHTWIIIKKVPGFVETWFAINKKKYKIFKIYQIIHFNHKITSIFLFSTDPS